MNQALRTHIEKRPVLSLAAGGLIAVTLYALVFGLLLEKPLTLGQVGAMMTKKDRIAAAAGPGKVLIVAGSNGRFSHSCEVISKVLERPCANLSITADIGPDVLFDMAARRLQPGDLVYMPLEYGWTNDRKRMLSDSAGPWLFRHDRARLWSLGVERSLHAAFAFDIRFLIEAIGETGLERAGISRREGVATMNAFGDDTSNTPRAAEAYRVIIGRLPWTPPGPPPATSVGEDQLGRLAAVARARGARVVGGLPTTFDDEPVSPAVIEGTRAIFARHGAGFVVIDNHSQYPRSLFFDSAYHLQAPAQAEHSRKVAEALRPLLP